VLGNNSHVGFHKIDLTGIKQIEFLLQATPISGHVGGAIEVHLDSPDGTLMGQTEMVEPKPIDYAKIMQMMEGKAKSNEDKSAKADTSKKKEAPAFDFSLMEQLLAIHAIANISPVEGMHNIYFVFKNSSAQPNQPLMQVMEINFKNVAAAPVAKKLP
jgi:cytochrome c